MRVGVKEKPAEKTLLSLAYQIPLYSQSHSSYFEMKEKEKEVNIMAMSNLSSRAVDPAQKVKTACQ